LAVKVKPVKILINQHKLAQFHVIMWRNLSLPLCRTAPSN